MVRSWVENESNTIHKSEYNLWHFDKRRAELKYLGCMYSNETLILSKRNYTNAMGS